MTDLRKVAEGLTTLAKYGDGEVNVGHDVIYAGTEALNALEPDDLLRLEELGWSWSAELECWERLT